MVIALTIEQMKHLQELGLDTSDASMSYVEYDYLDRGWHYELYANPYTGEADYPAFGIQDILKRLPTHIPNTDYVLYYNHNKHFIYMVMSHGEIYGGIEGCEVPNDTTTLDSAYRMLCWCLENKFI